MREEGETLPFRAGWEKVKKWFIHLLHLDDSAHRIALGVAIGMFVAITPTWGIQMLLVVGMAWLLRANKVAGVPMVWLTNPFTNVPIYSFCYAVGVALVGGPGLAEFKEMLRTTLSQDHTWAMLARGWLDLMWHVAAPLWMGCVVVGAAAGALAYGAMFYLIVFFRRRHRQHLAARHAAVPAAGADDGPAPAGESAVNTADERDRGDKAP